MLIELNEINFDAVRFYVDQGVSLPGFSKVLNHDMLLTEAEVEYEQLEPWIQWPSVHTGKTFAEHKVFRLGDITNCKDDQLFEKIEKSGFRVGAVSPMNASNKLVSAAYFIPDPWTNTKTDGSFTSRAIAAAVSQAVNDNSQSKLSITTIMSLLLAFFTLVNPKRFFPMGRYAITALGKSWRKALFLDMLLYEIHKTLFKKKTPNFSTLFLNAGAHIQHHYFFNSTFATSLDLQNPSWYIQPNEDPFLEMLKIYDPMLQDLLGTPDTEVIIATGLSQKPYDKLKFYYRLKDHGEFLNNLGIKHQKVYPRMTRDFLISFSSEEHATKASEMLSSILVDNKVKLFDEIDNRGKDVFVVLSYPNEIGSETFFMASGQKIFLGGQVTFVAIKNGEHQGKGFAHFSPGVIKYAPQQGSHVKEIHNSILDFFKISH